jgi:hypothetical protein
VVRYRLRGGEVGRPRGRHVSKARLRRLKKQSFSLAKLAFPPVTRMIADAKGRLSGTGAEVSHMMVTGTRKGGVEWRVYVRSSSDRKVVRYDRRGKFRSAN